MKNKFQPTFLTVLLCFFHAVGSWASPCGIERWPVKTLQDASAGTWPATVTASPSKLITFPAPPNLRTIDPSVRLPQEHQVYVVHALLLGFKKETDHDYHLVIADPTNPKLTMIAEIPDPSCANPAYADKFAAAREFVDRIATVSAKYRKLPHPIPVVITGVFFFDFLHGQTGVAVNGAEVHPTLYIQSDK